MVSGTVYFRICTGNNMKCVMNVHCLKKSLQFYVYVLQSKTV